MTHAVNFGSFGHSRALERLAALRPEWTYTVLHETEVPIQFKGDAIIIDPDNPPAEAKVWWLRVDPTDCDSLFALNGNFGSGVRDTHYIPADEASVSARANSLERILSGDEEDDLYPPAAPREAEASYDDYNLYSWLAATARDHLFGLGRDYKPDYLHRSSPTSQRFIAREIANNCDSDDELVPLGDEQFAAAEIRNLHPEIDRHVFWVARQWRIDALRAEWWKSNTNHPYDPQTPIRLVHEMAAGQWLGQVNDFIPGVGEVVPQHALRLVTGLGENETDSRLEAEIEAGRLLRLQDVNALVVAATWRPMAGFTKFATIDDIVNVFEPQHHDFVRERTVDAYLAETAGDLTDSLDALDSGFNFEGEPAFRELGLGDLGLGDA